VNDATAAMVAASNGTWICSNALVAANQQGRALATTSGTATISYISPTGVRFLDIYRRPWPSGSGVPVDHVNLEAIDHLAAVLSDHLASIPEASAPEG
jgi:hypothetical protein